MLAVKTQTQNVFILSKTLYMLFEELRCVHVHSKPRKREREKREIDRNWQKGGGRAKTISKQKSRPLNKSKLLLITM